MQKIQQSQNIQNHPQNPQKNLTSNSYSLKMYFSALKALLKSDFCRWYFWRIQDFMDDLVSTEEK